MKVVFAPEAEHDLYAAVDFLSSRNPVAAAHLFGNSSALVQHLADGAFEGPEQRLRSGETVVKDP